MIETPLFKLQKFITFQTSEIRRVLGTEKAIIACSGGVDSTTCAVLAHRALGKNLVCIFIDTGFMRINEPEEVLRTLSNPPLSLPTKLIDAKERFLDSLKGLKDAENKRKAFRDTFYSILSEISKKEKSKFLIQGTIQADIIETTAGVKTQHNVLQQININPIKIYGFEVFEPLASLYKNQVRAVARCLGIPPENFQRQPFPGPGLSVRIIGEITPEKLNVEKKANGIVEEELRELAPKQYFAAVFDKEKSFFPKEDEIKLALENLIKRNDVIIRIQVLRNKATGIKKGARVYGRVVLVDIKDKNDLCLELPHSVLNTIQAKIMMLDDGATRVLYRISNEKKHGKWIIAIRAVETFDFMEASVFNIPWKTFKKMKNSITVSVPDSLAVYYDITPKPPGTIEFE